MVDSPGRVLFTFRTFPQEFLQQYFRDWNVYVLGSLKQDITKLRTEIDAPSTELFGIALSKTTRQESHAINDFHHKKIMHGGPESIQLLTRTNWDIPISKTTTNTFCNYAMYSLGLHFPVCFIHTTKSDVPLVSALLNEQGTR